MFRLLSIKGCDLLIIKSYPEVPLLFRVECVEDSLYGLCCWRRQNCPRSIGRTAGLRKTVTDVCVFLFTWAMV